MDFDPNTKFSEICESLTKKIDQVTSIKSSADEKQAETIEKLRVQVCYYQLQYNLNLFFLFELYT